MRFALICCAVFAHRLSVLAAESSDQISLTVLPQGLHDTPALLRAQLQAAIDQAACGEPRPDMILLAYGLCSNGVSGLSGGDCPLLLPRTDDCIGLLLGGQSRYLAAFDAHSPIYWLSRGWVEHACLPTPENYAARKEDYRIRFGEENAAFLAEQDLLWTTRYRACGYIADPDDDPAYLALAERLSALYGWKTHLFAEDDRLLRLLLGGKESAELLYCPPGYRTQATGDEQLMTAVPIPPDEIRPAQNPPRSPVDA